MVLPWGWWCGMGCCQHCLVVLSGAGKGNGHTIPSAICKSLWERHLLPSICVPAARFAADLARFLAGCKAAAGRRRCRAGRVRRPRDGGAEAVDPPLTSLCAREACLAGPAPPSPPSPTNSLGREIPLRSGRCCVESRAGHGRFGAATMLPGVKELSRQFGPGMQRGAECRVGSRHPSPAQFAGEGPGVRGPRAARRRCCCCSLRPASAAVAPAPRFPPCRHSAAAAA